MIYDNFAPALRLPLSWVQSGTKKIKQRPVLLKGSGLTWLSLVEAPREMPFKKILSILQSRTPSGMIIRGCNNQLADYLHKQNFEICAIGQEAIIDLNKDIFSKKSLKTLVKRGAKHTTIKKVAASPLNQKKLKKLKQQSVHGNKPQLHYLFHDPLKNFTDCFVCENDKKEWIAAITVSYSDSGNAHTELLLRKSSAKTGTMEALIFFIFTYLKNAGYNSWSLGEVPFVNSENV